MGPAAGISRRGRTRPTLGADGQSWRIEEDALVGPDGARLERLPGHIAYWFAWQSFIEGAPLAEADAR